METPYLLKKVQEAFTKNESLPNSSDSTHVQVNDSAVALLTSSVSNNTLKSFPENTTSDIDLYNIEDLTAKSTFNNRLGVRIDWFKGSMKVLY